MRTASWWPPAPPTWAARCSARCRRAAARRRPPWCAPRAGRSQKASLVTAAAAAATMLLLAPVLGLLPNATLAAIVIVYSVGLIQPAEFLRDPPRAHDGVPLGHRGRARRADAGHAAGHRRRDRPVADRAVEPGGQSRPCTSSGASAGPTCCARCRRSTPTTRRSTGCSSCGRKGASSSSTRRTCANRSTRWSRSISRACWRST